MIPYPAISIRSKVEFVKRVCVSSKLTEREVKYLYAKVRDQKDDLWNDYLGASDVEKDKIVRSSFGELKKVLEIFDKKILACHDKILPPFVHGGLSKRSSIKAAIELMRGDNRSVVKFDLRRFFEQIKPAHILMFLEKSGCKGRAFRNFFAYTCCVPFGLKGNADDFRLARGFAPSGRLASWIAYPFCVAVKTLADSHFRGHEPRVACYFDDIGVSAHDVTLEQMKEFEKVVLKLAEKYSIQVNQNKVKHYSQNEKQEFLGVAKQGRHFFAGAKSNERRHQKVIELQAAQTKKERREAHSSLRGHSIYRKTVKKIAKE